MLVKSRTEIAARAGVSLASVSRVLAASRHVTLATRDRVLNAASELGFLEAEGRDPSPAASRTIGLIVADAENPFFAGVVGSIENVGYHTKHRLVLCNSDEDPERERFHLGELLAQRVGGVIILPVGGTSASIEPFARAMPIVCLDRRVPGLDLDLAIIDNRLASELAVRHLAELGHTRIAIIATHHETLNGERVGGYKSTLGALGIPLRPEYVRYGSDARQPSGYEQALHLLRLPEPPTAIFALNHLLLLGTMLAVRDRGLRAPDDVSLVGFDETPWSKLLEPALTTVGQPTGMLGTAAANLLIDRLDRGYTGPAREVMLPPTLFVRSSTRAPFS